MSVPAPVKRDQYNWKKAYFIPAYLLVAGLILYLQRDSAFYEQAHQSFADSPRWFGCIAFSYMGFALLIGASIQTHKDDMGFPWSYIWKYPLLCALYATGAFAVCQMYEQTRGYLFNFTAYPIAFLLGLISEITLPLLLARARERMPT